MGNDFRVGEKMKILTGALGATLILLSLGWQNNTLEQRVTVLETRVAILELANGSSALNVTAVLNVMPSTPTQEFSLTPTPSPEKAVIYQNTGASGVRVRACPGTTCAIVGKIDPNKGPELCEKTIVVKDGYRWMQIAAVEKPPLGGAWVAVDFLTEVNPGFAKCE